MTFVILTLFYVGLFITCQQVIFHLLFEIIFGRVREMCVYSSLLSLFPTSRWITEYIMQFDNMRPNSAAPIISTIFILIENVPIGPCNQPKIVFYLPASRESGNMQKNVPIGL
jgi:hypothetical protein